MRHGLLVVNASNGFGQHQANVDCLNLTTLHLLHLMRHGVGNNHLTTKQSIKLVAQLTDNTQAQKQSK